MNAQRKKLLKLYPELAKDSEALWALIAVLAMTVFLEVYQWV